MPRSHTCTLRIAADDYSRLKQYATEAEMKFADLLRHYISVGLRAETYAPLAPVLYRGRPKRGSHA